MEWFTIFCFVLVFGVCFLGCVFGLGWFGVLFCGWLRVFCGCFVGGF